MAKRFFAGALAALVLGSAAHAAQPVTVLPWETGLAPVTGVLVSSTLTTLFHPPAGRDYYVELTGTGSATVTVEYLAKDGSTYAPEVVAVDGGAPTIMNSIAYNGATQNGVRIPLSTNQYSATVKLLPGTVTGTVNFAIFAD